MDSLLLRPDGLQPEYVDHIAVRAAEAHLPAPGGRHRAAVAENVDVGESYVHCHRAQLAPLGVVIEAVADLMAPVAGAGALFVHKGDFDFWFHLYRPFRIILKVTHIR